MKLLLESLSSGQQLIILQLDQQRILLTSFIKYEDYFILYKYMKLC